MYSATAATHQVKKETMYYIRLDGPSAGMPTSELTGMCVPASGELISRHKHPEACSRLEYILGQQKYVVVNRRPWLVNLVNGWNSFITDLAIRNSRFIKFYINSYRVNPKYNPDYIIGPNVKRISSLALLLELGTKTGVTSE